MKPVVRQARTIAACCAAGCIVAFLAALLVVLNVPFPTGGYIAFGVWLFGAWLALSAALLANYNGASGGSGDGRVRPAETPHPYQSVTSREGP